MKITDKELKQVKEFVSDCCADEYKVKCNGQCHMSSYCSYSEAINIADYIDQEFDAEQQERIRLKTISYLSNLKKLSSQDLDLDHIIKASGGIECPLFYEGACCIVDVAPLDCKVNDKKEKDIQAIEKIISFEEEIFPNLDIKRGMLAQLLNYIWEKNFNFGGYLLSKLALKKRFKSMGTSFDYSWQDDGYDIRALEIPVILPEQGQYGEDLALVKVEDNEISVYGAENYFSKDSGHNKFLVLYKILDDSVFDWEKLEFKAAENNILLEDKHYVTWMSDSPQERFMMWEAAKRSRGKVLCGGMGMGVYQQMTLSLPFVESIDIVDIDENVIAMINQAWIKNDWEHLNKINIVNMPIEEYLESSDKKYDTIYIDTWDALYTEYLPHLNYLKNKAKKLLNDTGEILMWGYDFTLRVYLETALNIHNRREYFLNARPDQIQTLEKENPMFHKLVQWFHRNPKASLEQLRSAAYKFATSTSKNLGILSLSNHPAALRAGNYSR